MLMKDQPNVEALISVVEYHLNIEVLLNETYRHRENHFNSISIGTSAPRDAVTLTFARSLGRAQVVFVLQI